MRISFSDIERQNTPLLSLHRNAILALGEQLERKGLDPDFLIARLQHFQVAIPSWALGTGGTRFGRFPGGGEPRSLEEKLEDVGLLHALSRNCGAISLHIPWDVPEDAAAIRQLASELSLGFDAMNSNTFQDQPDQVHSYKFGSLCHSDPAVRKQAVAHNLEVIRQGEALGSQALTVWLADGSNFPGQQDFRRALTNTRESLEEIYAALPEHWTLLIEYKPYEPNFYSMVIPDWGTSMLLANSLGPKAKTLVDLGHHLPNTNIEQIIATLQYAGKLGGFHFNDSIYGDDDLTVGARNPYQLFLIFHELVKGRTQGSPEPAWMIDASHNTKDPLEDLLQSVEAILIAYVQALTIDQPALEAAQADNDTSLAQEILQEAFRTDVRPLLAEARLRAGGALAPLRALRDMGVREQLVEERGREGMATGL